jgi:hypothetical protein
MIGRSRRVRLAEPRTLRRGRQTPWSGRALSGAILACVLGLAAACTSTPPSQTQSTGLPNGTDGPKATTWPAQQIDSIIGLAAADSNFDKIGRDLTAALDSGNMVNLLNVSKEVQTFLVGNERNIPRLQAYDGTKALGDKLAPAYAQMIAGVTKIHDSLVAGDGAGVTAGFKTFAEGNSAYGALRAELARFAEQAVQMKGGLVR